MAISRRPGKFGDKRGRGGRGKQDRSGFVLTVSEGQNAGKEYFYEESVTIGRVEGNDLVLVEPGVSRNHVRISDDGGVFVVEDLGSANGTRLNGERLEASEVLRDGDYITLSATTLQFSSLTAARGEATGQTRLSDVQAQALDVTSTAAKAPAAGKSFIRSKKGMLTIAGVVLGLIVAVFGYRRLTSGKALVVFDASDTPVTYSDDETFYGRVFGNGPYNKTYKKQVAFNFEYLGGLATLEYAAWGVDKVGEVVILLNGEKVAAVQLTMNRWIYNRKMVLPRARLRTGKTNQIVFNNTRNPPNEDRWEICYVRVVQEAIPPPDVKEARHKFTLAKKAWEDREIEPSNMSTALTGFKKARLLMERLEAARRPELYAEALDMIGRVDKELTKRLNDGKFSARRAEKVHNDWAQARKILTRTRRHFLKEDSRYREVTRLLEALAE